MTYENINIRVDTDAAQAYRDADEQERRKLNLLLGWQIKECALRKRHDAGRDLLEIMKELSDEAERNGLTPEKLQEILDER